MTIWFHSPIASSSSLVIAGGHQVAEHLDVGDEEEVRDQASWPPRPEPAGWHPQAGGSREDEEGEGGLQQPEEEQSQS